MARDPLLDLARQRGILPVHAAGGEADAEAILRAAGLGQAEIGELRAELARAQLPIPIPGYRLIERIGIGAHSTVWRARQDSVERDVALKIIPARRPRDVERFLAEARSAGSIGSPYVVTCHEAGRSGEVLFLAMELLAAGDAETLAESLGGRIPERRCLEIVRDAARGLSALYAAALTHRDIKPANILLTAGGAKLADLGLARDAEAPIHRTVQSSIGEGTPAFMAPEQVRGEQLDVRSDLFSLGATCYRLMTGQLPFAGRTVVETLRLLSQGPSPDPSDAAPDLTDGTRLMIQVAMSRSRGLRYQHPDQFAEDAESVLQGRPPRHARRLRQQAYEAVADPRPLARGRPLAIRPWQAIAAGALALSVGMLIGHGLGGPSAVEFADLARARAAGDAPAWRTYLIAHPQGDGAEEAAAQLGLLMEVDQRTAAVDRVHAEAAQHLEDANRQRNDAPGGVVPAPPPPIPTPPTLPPAPPSAATGAIAAATAANSASAVPAVPAAEPAPSPPAAPTATPAAPATPPPAPPTPGASPSGKPAVPPSPPRSALPPAAVAALQAAQQRLPFGVAGPVDGLSCHPGDPLQLVAWNQAGALWHSADGARTWQAAAQAGPPVSAAAATRAWWAAKGKLVFIPATGSEQLGRLSEDGGKTFRTIARPAQIDNELPNRQPATITLYDRVLLADGELMVGCLLSNDSGPAWTLLSSPDRGRTWLSRMTCTTMLWSLIPTEVGLLVVAAEDAATNDIVRVKGDMRVSADLGRTWMSFAGISGLGMRHPGLLIGTADFHAFVVDGTAQITSLCTFTFSGQADQLRIFLPYTAPPGHLLRIDAFAIDPLDPSAWYCSGPQIGLLRSLDQGRTWYAYAQPGIVPTGVRSSLSFTAGPTPRLVLGTPTEAIIIQDRRHDPALFPKPLSEALPDEPAGSQP